MWPNKKFYIILLFGIVFLLLVIPAEAADISREYNKINWGVDPFVSHLDMMERKKEKKIQKKKQKNRRVDRETKIKNEIEKIDISGILKGESNLAIINGEVYEEGEVILGKKIVSIKSDYIVLEQAGYSFKKFVYEE